MRVSTPLFLLLLLASCAGDYGLIKKSEFEAVRDDAFRSSREIAEMKQSLAALQSEVADLGKKTPTEESISALRESLGSLYAQLSEMLKEVQVLSGRFDENKFFIDRQLKETSNELQLLKARIEGISNDRAGLEALRTRLDGVDAEIKKLNEALAAFSPGKPGQAEPLTPEKVYDRGLNAFKEKRFADARKTLEALVKEHSNHSLAGNAQFWIGESYFEEKDFDDAILAYEEVLEKYKDSPKAPAAMLKQALAFIELKDNKAARGILRELIGKYPSSEQAKTAAERLKKLSD
jgi:tol-pal system protein YbgF